MSQGSQLQVVLLPFYITYSKHILAAKDSLKWSPSRQNFFRKAVTFVAETVGLSVLIYFGSRDDRVPREHYM